MVLQEQVEEQQRVEEQLQQHQWPVEMVAVL
jgi:hypothetical protein